MVVPTYNERGRIAELARALFKTCSEHGLELELVIVDDNSPDGTGAVADELTHELRVRVIHRAGKLGLGTAVVAGFEIASASIVGAMDADFSHPPTLVPRMLTTFRATDADIVVASRYVPGGSTPNWPFSRRLLSRDGLHDGAAADANPRRRVGILPDSPRDRPRSRSRLAASRFVSSCSCARGRADSSNCPTDSMIGSLAKAR